ncbi:MAG: hypothetical protein J5644_09375 [Bacteroidales bacterium]|nr:hypothetical protein [Bacteroidales bacterium]
MIINFLVKALCEKESVYVNNLGLFRKEYEPAQIKDGMITPPGYKVVFDPDFDGNGFAFTMFVSQKGSLLITEATSQIDQWVQQLKTALDHNKSVSFGNFGTFAKESNDRISFICDRIAELNVEYEGMEPIELGKEESEEKEEKDGKEVVKDIKDFKKDVKESETEEDKEKEKEGKENGGKKKGWIVWIVVLLLLALLAVAAYYFRGTLKELYQKYFEQTEMVTEETVFQDTNTDLDTVGTSVTADSAILAEDTSAQMENAEISEENISITESATKANTELSQLPGGEKFFIDFEKGKHYVIVGSFRSEKEVRKHIKDRKLEQYNPKVVLQQNSKNMRICIGVFDTEAAADSFGRSTGLNYWVLN